MDMWILACIEEGISDFLESVDLSELDKATCRIVRDFYCFSPNLQSFAHAVSLKNCMRFGLYSVVLYFLGVLRSALQNTKCTHIFLSHKLLESWRNRVYTDVRQVRQAHLVVPGDHLVVVFANLDLMVLNSFISYFTTGGQKLQQQ